MLQSFGIYTLIFFFPIPHSGCSLLSLFFIVHRSGLISRNSLMKYICFNVVVLCVRARFGRNVGISFNFAGVYWAVLYVCCNKYREFVRELCDECSETDLTMKKKINTARFDIKRWGQAMWIVSCKMLDFLWWQWRTKQPYQAAKQVHIFGMDREIHHRLLCACVCMYAIGILTFIDSIFLPTIKTCRRDTNSFVSKCLCLCAFVTYTFPFESFTNLIYKNVTSIKHNKNK